METPLTGRFRKDGRDEPVLDLRSYGDYGALRTALTSMTPTQVIQLVDASGLRGRGGAGFPTGKKWSFVPTTDGVDQKYVVCNADEMEPGTFKDRLLLEFDPHALVESMALTGYALQATV